MKKFIYTLLFSLCILFFPKLVFASNSTTLQLQYYPLSDSGNEYIFKWLNDTSNDYIESKISNYDYYIIWVNRESTSSYTGYTIEMYFSNNIFYLRNTYNIQGASYFGPRVTDKFNQKYVFTIYQPTGSNYFYSSRTNFTDTYKINSLSDSVITSQQTSVNGVEFGSSIYMYYWTFTSQLSQNWNNKAYMSNIPLASNATRNLLLYNADTLEEIITINQGEVFPGYRELILSKPSYLSNYKKITLSVGKQYTAISGINKGIVYVPVESYLNYSPFLMYYENGLEYQPYTNIITNSSLTSDNQFIMIPFDFSNMSNINLVMFSKYDYVEGADDISYDIYVPNDSFTYEVLVNSNNLGGNDFSFNYEDLNGNEYTENFSVVDEDFIKKNELFNAMFENFSKNFFGLNSIISRPLDLLVNITNSSCEDLVLVLPFVNTAITLPCMESIYTTYFGSFFTIYQYLVSGFISYWILIELVRLIKEFKDPSYDKIEVFKL